MNEYQVVKELDELYENDASFGEKVFFVMKLIGYTSKQARLMQIKNQIKKELEQNISKAQIAKNLMQIYCYSKSGAYNLINSVKSIK